jgi:hypothetical protein
MARLNEEWTVQPHGPVERLDDGLITVAGEIVMPLGRFPRRMTVAALSGGRTAVWSAIPLAEPAMAEIEALGRPAFLVVPGSGHRLDVKPWKKRYPEARVVCAPGAREAVEEAVEVDASGDVLGDAEVRLETVPGTAEKESAMLVRRGGRLTLVVNDIIANVRHPQGVGAGVMARLLGFGVNGPQTPWIVGRFYVKDRAALAGALRRWAAEPSLTRIVVSHGEVIGDNPRGVLETVATELG